jgi:peptidoglycan/LPS O-acetylase OafA/YrhL
MIQRSSRARRLIPILVAMLIAAAWVSIAAMPFSALAFVS